MPICMRPGLPTSRTPNLMTDRAQSECLALCDSASGGGGKQTQSGRELKFGIE